MILIIGGTQSSQIHRDKKVEWWLPKDGTMEEWQVL